MLMQFLEVMHCTFAIIILSGCKLDHADCLVERVHAPPLTLSLLLVVWYLLLVMMLPMLLAWSSR